MASVQVGALVEAIEIYVRLLHTSVFGSDDGIELVQNDLKLHHGTVAVHILHTDVHVLFAPQLSPVFTELHPAAYLRNRSSFVSHFLLSSSTIQSLSSSTSFFNIFNQHDICSISC